jgi:sugar phosphate isomerase/epimerase
MVDTQFGREDVMKTSVSVKAEDVPVPMIVFEDTLEASFRKIAEIGYDGVELFMHSTQSPAASRIKGLLRDSGLQVGMLVALFDLIGNDVVMGHPEKAKRREFLDKAPYHLELAASVGARVPVGFTRGYIRPGTTEKDVRGWFVDGLHEYVKMAEDFGVTLVLEPINRYEINYINRVDEALPILDEVQSPNLKLLLDTFHMNIEEVSIPRAIRAAGDKIGHFHFVDSNRWPPGYGHTDLKEVFAELTKVGYEGFLGVEAIAKPSPETGARAGLSYIRTLHELCEALG